MSQSKNDANSDAEGDTNTTISNNSSSSRSSSRHEQKGKHSFDSVALAALGPQAKVFSMALLSTICFFTIVGYGVLLRDMLLPLSDYIFHANTNNDNATNDGPTFFHNITMLAVIFIVTPLCTLKDLTPLEKVGACSMLSIMTVACCIAYRSIQCNFSSEYDNVRLMPWYQYMNLLPPSMSTSSSSTSWITTITASFHDLLNALPILISVFMCHFNVLPVHNELQNPTPPRVRTLFATSIYGACAFYLFVGFTGSMYGNCTPDGAVEGNVLLSFEEDDVLLMVGRLCLSLTITFAFPILVVPCRDVLLRATFSSSSSDTTIEGEQEEVQGRGRRWNDMNNVENQNDTNTITTSPDDDNDDDDDDNTLNEPLLSPSAINTVDGIKSDSDSIRKITSIAIFWTGAIVACCVKSIDIVWDILGGSLSLMMGFLIPSACYIVMSSKIQQGQEEQHQQQHRDIMNQSNLNHGGDTDREDKERNGDSGLHDNGGTYTSLLSEADDEQHRVSENVEEAQNYHEQEQEPRQGCAYFLIGFFLPMIFLLTGNAIYNISHDQ